MARGVSSAVHQPVGMLPVDILITSQGYTIGCQPFQRDASDTEFLSLTKEVIQIFREIKNLTNRTLQTTNTIRLKEEQRDQYLVEMAKLGRRAYRKLFKQEEAQEALLQQIKVMQILGATKLAPLFKSELLIFPWEVLYEGDYRDGKPEAFWGMRYPVARHLIPKKTFSMELALPTDMLFCLNHRLPYAPQQERPAIEAIARKIGKFKSLQDLLDIDDGVAFLEHLYQSGHNMLHFACHCRPCRKYEDDIDALSISLLEGEPHLERYREIELETYNFDDIDGNFQRPPLVFLNACQSGGGLDELRKTFNLPARFIEHGAGAVIATACEVPDSFAALFAKVFYEFFLDRRMMIGEALCKTRWYFLTEYNNPLGLAYGLYTPAYYRLSQPPMMEGVA